MGQKQTLECDGQVVEVDLGEARRAGHVELPDGRRLLNLRWRAPPREPGIRGWDLEGAPRQAPPTLPRRPPAPAPIVPDLSLPPRRVSVRRPTDAARARPR